MSTQPEINTRIKLKRDTEANWEAASDKTILNGEVVLVDGADGRLRVKIGDGTSMYSELEFIECIYVITEENKDEEIPANAMLVLDTTEEGMIGGVVGAPGEGAVSPTVRIVPIEGGHRVTITDIVGTQFCNVMDGSAPIKGTDYWTAEDKAEIVSEVLAQIPNGNGVAY